jgi:hypothetical protein
MLLIVMVFSSADAMNNTGKCDPLQSELSAKDLSLF